MGRFSRESLPACDLRQVYQTLAALLKLFSHIVEGPNGLRGFIIPFDGKTDSRLSGSQLRQTTGKFLKRAADPMREKRQRDEGKQPDRHNQNGQGYREAA